MTGFTLTTTLAQPYDDAVEAVRAALDDQGFGILTEIDPDAMIGLSESGALDSVATDAKHRLTTALAALTVPPEEN